MRSIIYLLVVLFLSSCTKEVQRKLTNLDQSAEGEKANGTIDARLFEHINLDYPGLEKTKALVQQNNTFEAAKALLDYYRLRTNVVNPNISLLQVTATTDDRLKADFALDNSRFFVNNYYENAITKTPYSLNSNGRINWSFVPAGADNEYQKQLHRHQWFVPQAKVYRATNDEKYIQSWIKTYKDWLAQNPMPESGVNTTTWWQLQVAARTIDQTQLFEYYKNSISFTPEWFSEFMVHFAEHADFLVKYPYTEGNILITQGNALAYAGVLFPEFKNAKTWRDTGFQTLDTEVKKQFLADGMHYELDFSYHISAIADFYEIIKLADANKSIVGDQAADFSQYLHKAALVVMNFVYPSYFTNPVNGYLVPGFNDTRQSSWTRSVLNKNFGWYREMFPNDNEIQYMSSYGQSGKMPSVAPKSFGNSGYYMLRNGWDKNSSMMILSNNFVEGAVPVWSHNQLDNGTFELYHKGRNFFPDAGVFAYMSDGNNSAREWYRQTRVHNTMTLDSKNITAGKGQKLAVTSNGQIDVVVFENQGYSNLKHRRYVFYVNKSFFVLVDEAIGSATGTVNLNFNLCEGENEVVLESDRNGAYTNFTDGNNIVVRSFGSDVTSYTPFSGKVSYTLGVEASRKAYAVNTVKSITQTPRFITVIYPTNQPATTQVNAVFNRAFSTTGVDVKVSVNGVDYNLNCNL